MYGLCLDERTFKRVTKMICGEARPYPTSAGCCVSFHGMSRAKDCSIVTMQRMQGRSRTQIIGLLAHEATHVFQNLCELQNDHKPSEEFQACGIQRITMDLIDEYVRLGGKI
jgi:hypothetical protein